LEFFDILRPTFLRRDGKLKIQESRRRAVKRGKHLVVTASNEAAHQELSMEEKAELLVRAIELAEESALAPGRWRIVLNGPGLATRPTFHIHIICPHPEEKLLRVVTHVPREVIEELEAK